MKSLADPAVHRDFGCSSRVAGPRSQFVRQPASTLGSRTIHAILTLVLLGPCAVPGPVAWSAERRGRSVAEQIRPESNDSRFTDEWILVQLDEPLDDVAIDGSFALRTGRIELDALIRDAGIHRIELALLHSGLAPGDPESFRRHGLDRVYAFHVPHGTDISSLVERAVRLPGVVYAEPDFTLAPDQTNPNDTRFGDQWNLHNTGQNNATPDADVDAPEGWDLTTGNGVIIAIVDSGADSDHPDLVANLIPGRNFEYFQDPNNTEDTNGHGTRVASVAAAVSNNDEGIAGVCWNCRIMPIKAGPNSLARGFADALVWATDHGARVINVSQHTENNSQTMHKGIGYAADAGVVITTSAGNDAVAGIPYPARYVETIAVGGTDKHDHWSSPMCGQTDFESRTGPELDVVGPAEYVPVADLGGGYTSALCGTSFSAPTVAGLAGLIESVNPAVGREEARHLIRAGADDGVGDPSEDAPGFDVYHGWGRVNVHRSLEGAQAALSLRVDGKTATRVYLETANPLADSWDFVRGDLGALGESPMGVRLGSLTCLENDSPDGDTAGDEDTDVPAPGEAFFYLARFHAAPGAGTYGGSSGNRDRLALSESTPADWTADGGQDSAGFGAGFTAGDVDADGWDDVIVGAITYDGTLSSEGAAFVYRGSTAGLAADPVWTVTGGQSASRFGWCTGSAGDVNGDGYDDVVVGAPRYDNGETNEGMAFVYHGGPSGPSETPDWSDEGNQANAQFGYWVQGVGDVNGDTFDDVLVSAPYYDNGEINEGRVYLYFGSESGLSPTPDWTAEADQDDAFLGLGAFFVPGNINGDVDADGDPLDDIVVGAPGFDNGETDEGRVFVFYGSATGPGSTPDATLEIDIPGAWFGGATSSAGDADGDGFDDFVIGAPYYANGQTDEGAVLLYLGSSGGIAGNPTWSFESDQAGAELGWLASSAGDVDGDGYDDIVSGAYAYDGLRTDEGKAWVFLGSPSGLEADPAWSTTSGQSGARLGGWGGTAGDVNGDGKSDVILGALEYDHLEFDEGRALVYHGPMSESDALDCAR